MTQQQVKDSLRSYVEIDEKHLEFFFQNAEQKKLAKNEVLTSAGDKEVPFVLIQSGCLLTYFIDKKNNKHVIQFGTDMWWTGDLEAFTKNTPSRYFIKALAPSEVYLISQELYNNMLDNIPEFDRYFRIIFQNALISHQRRIVRNISYTAEEKYLEFVNYYPKIEMLVPQKYIASYLGITPEFLSKIRRKLAGR